MTHPCVTVNKIDFPIPFCACCGNRLVDELCVEFNLEHDQWYVRALCHGMKSEIVKINYHDLADGMKIIGVGYAFLPSHIRSDHRTIDGTNRPITGCIDLDEWRQNAPRGMMIDKRV